MHTVTVLNISLMNAKSLLESEIERNCSVRKGFVSTVLDLHIEQPPAGREDASSARSKGTNRLNAGTRIRTKETRGSGGEVFG